MRALGLLLVCFLTFLSWQTSVQAHHSFMAHFDRECPVAFEGTVTKVEWYNPHVWIHLDVTDENGVTESWAFEFGSPNALIRRGWRRSSIAKGDTVTAKGLCARDGSNKAAARAIILPDGSELFAAQREDS